MKIHKYNKFSHILLPIIVFTVGILTSMSYLFPACIGNNTSALTYQSDTKISFDFATTLSIHLSDTGIAVPTLVPGTTAESAPLTVTVTTNAAYGYSLLASVGNDTAYNTSDLVHENNTIGGTPSASFASIPTTASLNALDTDNTWGYSYKATGSSAWSSYHGLPLYSDVDNNTSTESPAMLVDTYGVPTGDKSIDFKIAARASATQPSGSYNNVINFYAVGKPAPLYMQDAAAIKLQLANVGDAIRVIDQRDGKEYWVAKFADSNIWMTENLDHNIVAGRTYTPADTDIPTNWVPANGTHLAGDTTWVDTDTAPESYDPGELYWNGELSDNWRSDISKAVTKSSNMHHRLGNYYNWTAAIATNDSSAYAAGQQDANQSICPAGWRLPTYSGDKSFHNLISTYNPTSGFSGDIQQSPLFFMYGGQWNGYSVYYSWAGFYWTSVAASGAASYELYFDVEGFLSDQEYYHRYNGYSVRCIMR